MFRWPVDAFNKSAFVNKHVEPTSKEARLEVLKAKLASFEGLSFSALANNLVFGEGNCEAGLMFVGEAPGQEEDIVGRPFVGKSGKLLTLFLETLGFDRSHYYITSVLPWRPPSNRTPTLEEIEIMKPFLFEHIDIVNPYLIVAVGASALKALGISESITSAQGNVYELSGRKIYPIYHPAYALRVPKKKSDLWFSLLKMEELFKTLKCMQAKK